MRKLIVLAALLAACSGNSISGTVDGKAIAGDNAVVGHFFGFEGFTPTIVLMTNAGTACAAIRENKNIKSTSGVYFILGKKTGADRTAATEVGTYIVAPSTAIPEGNFALVQAYNQDATCVDVLDESKSTGVSGTVTLEAYAEGGAASGKFDVQFAGGSKLSGEFDADACNATAPDGEPICG